MKRHNGRLARAIWATLSGTLFLLAASIQAHAQEPAPEPIEAAEWLAVFEQSYGREGLYVIEIAPADPGASTRLNIQALNAAAQRLQAEHPDQAVSIDALEKNGLLPELKPRAEDDVYTWDADAGTFRGTLPPPHDPAAGPLFLLEGNERIRERILRPDNFSRTRWKKVYTDPETPQFLKKEIELREFLLDHFYFQKALIADSIHEQLKKLEEVLKLYAIAEGKQVGDPVNWAGLETARFGELIPRFPKGTEVRLDTIGESPTAIYGGMEITADPASVGKIRREHAQKIWEKYPTYPPVLALRARFEKPSAALPLINEAIAKWPGVPGLRVERMTHLARLGRIPAWTDDLDFVLRNFPAAPLLIEIQILAETDAFPDDLNSEAEFATVLADVRPDLLTHQLYAIQTLTDAGRLDDAQTVYDRLVYGNPAWGLVLPPPEKQETSPPQEE